ncbi:MAG TPA: Dabb family protein [Cyclobacteriaceae bacterium]|nr:Dabb family protein [Cyclobacteriaceae bacterium]
MRTRHYLFLGLFAAIAVLSAFMYPKKGEVKHIVIFKYKESATPEQINEVTTAFKDLKNKIQGIQKIEYGVNNSPEKLNKGFTHVYLLTFKDVSARDAYLPHPEHKKFGELLGKLNVVEEVFVVDFQPEQ